MKLIFIIKDVGFKLYRCSIQKIFIREIMFHQLTNYSVSLFKILAGSELF